MRRTTLVTSLAAALVVGCTPEVTSPAPVADQLAAQMEDAPVPEPPEEELDPELAAQLASLAEVCERVDAETRQATAPAVDVETVEEDDLADQEDPWRDVRDGWLEAAEALEAAEGDPAVDALAEAVRATEQALTETVRGARQGDVDGFVEQWVLALDAGAEVPELASAAELPACFPDGVVPPAEPADDEDAADGEDASDEDGADEDA